MSAENCHFYLNKLIQAVIFVLTILWTVWEWVYWVHEPFYAVNKQLVDWMAVVLIVNWSIIILNFIVNCGIGKNSNLSFFLNYYSTMHFQRVIDDHSCPRRCTKSEQFEIKIYLQS